MLETDWALLCFFLNPSEPKQVYSVAEHTYTHTYIHMYGLPTVSESLEKYNPNDRLLVCLARTSDTNKYAGVGHVKLCGNLDRCNTGWIKYTTMAWTAG